MDMLFDSRLLRIGGMRRMLVACVAFSLARALAVLGQAAFLARGVVMLWQGAPLPDAISSIGLFACCFLVRQVLACVQDSVVDGWAAKSSDALFASLLDDAFEAGAPFVRAGGSAALVANAIDGTADIEKYLRLAPIRSVDVIAIPLVLLVAIFAFDIVSGVIALVCYPFVIIYMRLIGATAVERASRQHAQFERLSNTFVDISAGVTTLKAFGAERRMAGRILEASERFRKTVMRTLRVAMLSGTVLDLFATLALAAVAIMLGFRMVEGAVAFFPALAVLVLVPEYFKPIREFGSDYHATLDGRTALATLDEYRANVACSDVHRSRFWSRDAPWSDGMSIDTRAHETVVVAGPSGCGKTTLLDVLAGFSDPPPGVDIVVDGMRESTLRRRDWQQRVSYIPQDPYVFHASLRDNVAFYNRAARDDEIVDALDCVGLADLLAELDQGLDTILGEGGRVLSGGQTQRVALCRALLDAGRDVWVLDEPTSHVDEETERDLHERVLELGREKTLIIATHSPLWERGADRVLRAGVGGGDRA